MPRTHFTVGEVEALIPTLEQIFAASWETS